MGGRDVSKQEFTSVLVYDIASDSWAKGVVFLRAMGRCVAAFLDDQLYLIGDEEVLVHGNAGWVRVKNETPFRQYPTCNSIFLG